MVPRESFLMAPINIEIDDVMSMNHGFWNFKSNLQMLVLTIMTEKYTHKLPQRISDWFLKNMVFERIFITGRLSLNFIHFEIEMNIYLYTILKLS